jgi:hypothetical protein
VLQTSRLGFQGAILIKKYPIILFVFGFSRRDRLVIKPAITIRLFIFRRKAPEVLLTGSQAILGTAERFHGVIG